METATIIGCDIGGTKSAVARFNAETFQLETYDRFPTNAERGFDAVLNDLIVAIKKLQTSGTKAVGVGFPGLIKQPDGILVKTPNIPGGENIPVKTKLTEALNLPVFVENDARCFTLSEALQGAGKGYHVVVGVTLGTGVGGGIVIDGKIFQGAQGFAGEIGHMLLMPGKPPYESDNMRGEAEQFFSGTALGRRCDEASKPQEYLAGEVCAYLHPEIYKEIAWLCTNLTHLINPSIIVFGGSAGKALAPHLEDIRKELRIWLLPNTPLPELAIATNEHPGTLGAALLSVWQKN